MRTTTRWATIILAAAAGACGRGREPVVPAPPAARVEDILGTSGAVAPRRAALGVDRQHGARVDVARHRQHHAGRPRHLRDPDGVPVPITEARPQSCGRAYLRGRPPPPSRGVPRPPDADTGLRHPRRRGGLGGNGAPRQRVAAAVRGIELREPDRPGVRVRTNATSEGDLNPRRTTPWQRGSLRPRR